jgi:hypothetical protein
MLIKFQALNETLLKIVGVILVVVGLALVLVPSW